MKKKQQQQKRKNRVFSPKFRLAVVQRIEGGESLLAVSQELGIRRTVLYRWRQAYRESGADGLSRRVGRPRAGEEIEAKNELEAARRRIAELERKVGQQALANDFLGRAFKRVEELRRPNTESGGTASTEKSGL